jgi:preprotein translocase subunit SecA
MGFWTWLTGKGNRVTTIDRIWLTRPAKCRALSRELKEHFFGAQPLMLLAHFPTTLTEMAEQLARQGVPHQVAARQISTKEVNSLADRGTERLTQLGLVKQLQTDPFARQEVENEEGAIQILVAERHFLRKHDEEITDFARSLTRRSQITYHLSLEDPLMKIFAGEWVRGLLQRLGMDEGSPIESSMVARRIRDAQEKFARQADHGSHASSAEEWLQSNGFE